MFRERRDRGQGRRRGDHGRRERHRHDQSVFHRLLERHAAIERQVEKLPSGVRTLTRSDDPEVVALLHEHVPSMHERLHQGFRLRRWDPLYEAIFDRADAIEMQIQLLDDGVEVLEVSDDHYVVALIQAHAEAVSAFVSHGQAAASRPSPMPE